MSLVVALALLMAVLDRTEASEKALTFGVVPQQAASKLARLWAPILDYIGDETGVRLVFHTAPDIPEFERRLAAGAYDLAYMNPYHYTVFHQKPGYEAFAKQKDTGIQGIVVVGKESPVRDIGELDGMTLAFPAPAAFAASVLPRAYFRDRNITILAKYVSSHDSVYRAVAAGLYPAGGGIERTFSNVDPAIREQLRILWTSPRYTPHAFAAHPRVPSAVVARIRDAAIAMDASPVGMNLLQAINFKGIEAAADADWNDVRGLGIKTADTMIQGDD